MRYCKITSDIVLIKQEALAAMDTPYADFGGRTTSKSLALFLVILSLVGYKLWKRQIRLKVRASEGICRRAADIRQEEDQYAAQMGCKAPRRWAAKWPQGLDLLLKVGQHARAQTILQFFLDVVESSGPTHEQQLRKSPGA